MSPRRWLSTDLLGAILLSGSVHAIPISQALRDLVEMRLFVDDGRKEVHEYLWTQYEVELKEPSKEEKMDPPPPEPEAPPPPPKPVVVKQHIDKEPPPPPVAAQAAQTLTAKDDGKPVDFSDFTLVQGAATAYAGGVTARDGISDKAVYDRNAQPGGTPGATGSGPPPPPPKVEDKSRPASLSGSSDWHCGFPPEADADDINAAIVMIAVTVRPDGSPQSVSIISDPGHGFGRAARACAMAQRYTPALDRDGNPIVGTTAPFRVRFNR